MCRRYAVYHSSITLSAAKISAVLQPGKRIRLTDLVFGDDEFNSDSTETGLIITNMIPSILVSYEEIVKFRRFENLSYTEGDFTYLSGLIIFNR